MRCSGMGRHDGALFGQDEVKGGGCSICRYSPVARVHIQASEPTSKRDRPLRPFPETRNASQRRVDRRCEQGGARCRSLRAPRTSRPRLLPGGSQTGQPRTVEHRDLHIRRRPAGNDVSAGHTDRGFPGDKCLNTELLINTNPNTNSSSVVTVPTPRAQHESEEEDFEEEIKNFVKALDYKEPFPFWGLCGADEGVDRLCRGVRGWGGWWG